MNAVDSAKEHLLRFCKDKDQHVCAFKGPWGVGKSYLIRKLISENNPALPDHVSYVSVFGLSSIKEVQDRMIGCLEQRQSLLGGSIARWGSKATKQVLSRLSKAKIPVPFVPLELPDLSAAVFWHIAKRSGLLIVFDDLERANPALQLDQLLGLASSIAENSSAKIVLVFNDEELKGDGPKTFARFREKVVDSEFNFCPSIAELVVEYLGIESLTPTVVSCLEVKGGPNIRLILRIKRGLEAFNAAVESVKCPFDQADLVQMAKVIWHFYVSPVPIKADVVYMMRMARTWRNMGLESESKITDDDEEAMSLAKRVSLDTNAFDGLMLEYLNNGYLPEEYLRRFADDDSHHRKVQSLQEQVDAVCRLYDKNFVATEDQIVQSIELVLANHVHEMSLGQMRDATVFLTLLHRPAEDWWLRHITSIIGKLGEEQCKAYLAVLPDSEAKEAVQLRFNALAASFDPKTVFQQVAEGGGGLRRDIERMNNQSIEFYRSWFATDNGDSIELLRLFLSAFSNRAEGTPERKIYDKIVAVLRSMASDSSLNCARITNILEISCDGPSAAEIATNSADDSSDAAHSFADPS